MWTTASSLTSAWRSRSGWRKIRRWRAARRCGERKTAPFVRPSMARDQGPSRSASFVIRTKFRARADGPHPSAARPGREQLSRSSLPGLDDASRIAAKVGAAGAFRPLPSWRLGLAAVVRLPGLRLVSRQRPSSPAKGLGEAAVAAFRAFVRPGVAPVEFATGDSGRIARVADDASLAPGLPPRDPFSRQPGRREDRSLSWRAGCLSRLQVAGETRRLAGPVS